MLIEIKAPSPGESITQVVLASWVVDDGAFVGLDADIAEIESDKATLMVFAPAAGVLKIKVAAGSTIDVGAIIGWVYVDALPEERKRQQQKKQDVVVEEQHAPANVSDSPLHMTPLAKNVASVEKIDFNQLKSISKEKIKKADLDIILHSSENDTYTSEKRSVKRVKMSPLRQKLAERLVSVKNETAMLTTFNEIDMQAIVDLRKQYGEAFKNRYGNSISYLSFFVMAAQRAFAEFPQINAAIEGNEIVYHEYADICIAVSTPKGLLAPVIRDVQTASLPQINQAIHDFGQRAQNNKITLDELRDGTFTITNGGTFGSLLSTPIINPPQSAILGMHKIEDRAVVDQGKIIVKPMMYVALSYDHRLIDGKESVGFIIKVKEILEHPLSLCPIGEASPEALLGIV